jgi:hypothetical protein
MSWGYVRPEHKVLWFARENGIEIYKDGGLVGVIPHHQLPLLICDAARLIDYACVIPEPSLSEGHEGLPADAAHPDAG